MKLAILFCLFILSACGGGSAGGPSGGDQNLPLEQPQAPTQPTSDTSGDQAQTITQSIDGELVSRTYQLRYPENPTEDSYPVVFFFHGAGGNRTDWLQQNPSIANLIDTGEFIGIFPQGYQ